MNISFPQETQNPPRDSHNHNNLHSIISTCYPITLKFIDVSYKVKLDSKDNIIRMFHNGALDQGSTATIQERTVLNSITGMVSPGEMLAVLGPSGSGKSTLLNALAGRLHGHAFTGSILANGRKLNKSVLKKTGFVTQDDVLYPHLTVRETLVYCSLLRLPNTLTNREKTDVADSVISELGLRKCENTIIGNAFVRGVSGGERKRVSIGHEMLINPSLLILDEPTSGLDSTAAHRLIATLSGLAQKGKTVLMSVHQPSSRVYQMFDKVLVLSEGRSIYIGKSSEAMSYFESIGFSPSFPMNPADFLLDLANGVFQHEYGGTTSEREKPNIKQTLVSSYNKILSPIVKCSCMETNQTLITPNHNSSNTKPNPKFTVTTAIAAWFNQFTILLKRSLKERKHESFNSLRVFQVVTAAILAGVMWWHSDYRDVQDRLGLLFFISIFWGVIPSFSAVFAFPQERAIFVKERASGMYTLSSYFMSRIIGDLPTELVLPTLFITITYWMTGLKSDVGAFLQTVAILLLYVLVSQGLGLFLGALIMDAKQASTISTVTMLAFVLTGGYYVHKVPYCMAWIKYVSTTFYCYKLFTNAQYGQGEEISHHLGCNLIGRNRNPSCKSIEDDVVGQIHPLICLTVLFIMLLGYRLLAYMALWRIKG